MRLAISEFFNRGQASSSARWLLAIALIVSGPAAAEQIRVAVASNFKPAMQQIVADFESISGHSVTLVVGSTGKQYAQIINGAPFDMFFAADVLRPQLLENAQMVVPASRFTYAIGKLLLWSREVAYVDNLGSILSSGNFRHLALANPELAPYGVAAREVLQTKGLWDTLGKRMVKGENIAQAFQYVNSGNAELGLLPAHRYGNPGRDHIGKYRRHSTRPSNNKPYCLMTASQPVHLPPLCKANQPYR